MKARKECIGTLEAGDRVLEPTKKEVDREIAPWEVIDAINAIPTGKSPGPDRIPNRFYRTFSKLLAPILANVFNESRDAGKLHDSMMEGIISVMYKKNDRDDPRNYRPITLLNLSGILMAFGGVFWFNYARLVEAGAAKQQRLLSP